MGDALCEEGRVDGAAGVLGETAHADQRAPIVEPATDEALMRVKDIDDIAGVSVPGRAFDRAGEDPGVAVAHSALAVGAQVEGWIGHFLYVHVDWRSVARPS